MYDVGVMLAFSVIGCFLNKLEPLFQTMPLILGIMLGDDEVGVAPVADHLARDPDGLSSPSRSPPR